MDNKFTFTGVEITVSLLVVFVIVFVAYFKWSFSYWKIRKVTHIDPRIPFGDISNSVITSNTYVGLQMKNEYQNFKSQGLKYAGVYLFSIPKLALIDPKLFKSILQEDFDYFTDRGFYHNEQNDPLSANLFAIGGEKWKYVRTKLSPAFTSKKLKLMFDSLLKCGYQLSEAVNDISISKHKIDVKDISVCYSIDVIGSCAFGLKCNSFKESNSSFREEAKRIFDFSSIFRRVTVIILFLFPTIGNWFKLRLFDQKTTKFFLQLVEDIIKHRVINKVVRHDMINLFMEFHKEDFSDENFDKCSSFQKMVQELAAQVFIFFAAGFETSSTTLTYCLYELAVNTDIQEKARKEITDVLVKFEDKITYEAINEMTYLDQIVHETLRKYPPVTYLSRVCVKDYNIPNTDVVIEKGIEIGISILGLHHYPDYYPEPDHFDPERFSPESKKSRLPYTYLPFGEGPRMCIGLRFGLMQIKVALTVLLKQYKFSSNKSTVEPIEFEPNSFTLIPKKGIFVNVEKFCN